MVRHRVIFGALMIAGVCGLLAGDWKLEQSGYLGWLPGSRGALFGLFVGLLAVGGSFELGTMARAKGIRPLTGATAIAAAALIVSPLVARIDGRLAPLPIWVLAGGTILIFLAQAVRHRAENALANVGAALLTVCYLGGLGLFAVLIRIEHATIGLLTYLAAVKLTDIGAWAVGRKIGRHKMIPWLSPGKSWEGLAGGVAASVAACVALGLSTGLMGGWQSVLFGLVMAPVGQCGDLAESLLKRDCGLKDAGAVVPGFGGLLDILDSPLGAAPVGYLMLAWLT